MRRALCILALTLLGAVLPIPFVWFGTSTLPGGQEPIVTDIVVVPALCCGGLFLLAAICAYIPPRGVPFLRSLILLVGLFVLAALVTTNWTPIKGRSRIWAFPFPILTTLVAFVVVFRSGFRCEQAESAAPEIKEAMAAQSGINQ